MRRKPANQVQAYGIEACPVGWLAVVCSPAGIVEIMLEKSPETLHERLDASYPGVPEAGDGVCVAALGQLREYFSGGRREFSLPIDLAGLSPFAREVLAALQQVPAGGTVSYGALAARVGRPGAARAVGRVMGGNPIPLVIPCHRVVGASGALVGYSGAGGVATKEWLLEFERKTA